MNERRGELLELLGKILALGSASDWIPNLESRKAFDETAQQAIDICKELLKKTPRE